VNSTFGENRMFGLNFINRVLLRTLYLVVNRETVEIESKPGTRNESMGRVTAAPG